MPAAPRQPFRLTSGGPPGVALDGAVEASAWGEGITSVLDWDPITPSAATIQPRPLAPPQPPALDSRGRPLGPIPRAPTSLVHLALSSSTAALLAKRKAPPGPGPGHGPVPGHGPGAAGPSRPGKRADTRGREKVRLRAREAGGQDGAGEQRAMQAMKARLPTFRLSNGSAGGKGSAQGGDGAADGVGGGRIAVAVSLDRAGAGDADDSIRQNETIVFDSPLAESTQIAQQRPRTAGTAAGATTGNISTWRELQLTLGLGDDNQAALRASDDGDAHESGVIESPEEDVRVADAPPTAAVPLDPPELRRARRRREMRKDAAYLTIMDVFPEVRLPALHNCTTP